MIQENPYMQYLCGLSEFTDKPLFDPSLFTTVRKRITYLPTTILADKIYMNHTNSKFAT